MQPDTHEPPKLTYSIAEAIKATSLGKTTLFAAIRDQRLKAVRIKGRTLIPADSLRAFVLGEAN